MTRAFIRLPEFEKQAKHLGLSEYDIMNIEDILLTNPDIGDVIQGTGGMRKFRIALTDTNKGKRGGARIIYIDFVYYKIIYFITAYSKSEMENLSQAERNDFKNLTKILESELKKRKKQ
ncbi:MAG: type II toxin-antitoxin system RelE/ParE family toxin [Oscillospiraceae bacterium]|nr:type II toxin-antitoxin system RelE/ParE family toxin [Oscillospiraceae bacterium]